MIRLMQRLLYMALMMSSIAIQGQSSSISTPSVSPTWPIPGQNAVTPVPCGSGVPRRLGDALLLQAHVLYFAMKNKCEMLHIPFQYSQELVLSDEIRQNKPENEALFKHKLTFYGGGKQAMLQAPVMNTLIGIPYFSSQCLPSCPSPSPFPHFYIDWDDATFKEKLRSLIKPKKHLSLLRLPKDKISVAVHVRKGGTFETFPEEICHSGHLYKFPNNQFYIDNLKDLSALLDDQPLYVYLFTDDENPEQLAQLFKEAVNIPSITFDYRKKDNHHNANVLEDFFSLMHFDAIIRGDSNFSSMAERLGDPTIVISPGEFKAGLRVQAGAIRLRKPLKDLCTKYAPMPTRALLHEAFRAQARQRGHKRHPETRERTR